MGPPKLDGIQAKGTQSGVCGPRKFPSVKTTASNNIGRFSSFLKVGPPPIF